MSEITLFSWGYWGWGTKTKAFVDAANAVEKSRGFEPPFFVDIRFNRSVRAPGFRDKTFENLLGSENYLWMRSLGNRSISTGEERIQIDDPIGADALLDLAAKLHQERRRVIFYCACDVLPFSGSLCHRYTVAGLLRKVAAKKSIPVSTIEWPGGDPRMISLPPKPQIIQGFKSKRRAIPASDESVEPLSGIPWFSPAQLHSESGESQFYFLGPGRLTGKHWGYLNLPVTPPRFRSANQALDWAAQQRSDGYLAANKSAKDL